MRQSQEKPNTLEAQVGLNPTPMKSDVNTP